MASARRWQFSLAQLLAAVTVVAVWLAIVKCCGTMWPLPVMVTVISLGSLLCWKVGRRLSVGGRIALVVVACYVYSAIFQLLLRYSR